jgi:hypothetical protein
VLVLANTTTTTKRKVSSCDGDGDGDGDDTDRNGREGPIMGMTSSDDGRCDLSVMLVRCYSV